MLLLSIPGAAEIFIAWLVVIGIMIAVQYKRNYCFKHRQFKDLRSYYPQSNKKYCSLCAYDATNPPVKCDCGWNGRLIECPTTFDLTTMQGEDWTNYHCPDCEKKIKQPK